MAGEDSTVSWAKPACREGEVKVRFVSASATTQLIKSSAEDPILRVQLLAQVHLVALMLCRIASKSMQQFLLEADYDVNHGLSILGHTSSSRDVSNVQTVICRKCTSQDLRLS